MFRYRCTILLLTMVFSAMVEAQWQPCQPSGSLCQANGGVGILTTSPSQALDVNGNVLANSFGAGGAAPSGYQFFATTSVHATPSAIQLRSSYDGTSVSYLGNFGSYGTVISLNRDPRVGTFVEAAAPPNQFRAGHLMVGDIMRGRLLQVANFPGGQETPRLVMDYNGNLGIGTIAPAAKLDLYSPNSLALNTNGWASIAGGVYTAPSLAAGMNAFANSLAFRSGGVDNRIIIDTAGRVGIGTVSPTVALEVNGSIKAASVIGAVYQDLAEWVPATEEMAPGTVVIIADARNTVSPSERAYDTRVAGVVSLQPGLLLGVEGPSKAMIATTGRVKVRVDASRGAVKPGDLLVTSEVPGVAMRSEVVEVAGVKMHRPGTLIGKALEPLDHAQGEILVLLSLQ